MPITQFPHFKTLELGDREFVNSVTKKYPTYSDFNFISMLSWNTDGKTKICNLNDNLAVEFSDYITGEPVFSLLGIIRAEDSINKLIDYSLQSGGSGTLEMIPHTAVTRLKNPQTYIIEEDINNFDYILSAKAIMEMRSSKFRGKRSAINHFLKNYGSYTILRPLNLTNEADQKDILGAFELWRTSRNIDAASCQTELSAIKKLFTYADKLDVFAHGIYIDNTLRAFAIGEITPRGVGVIHFEKADVQYKGIFPYLNQQMAALFFKGGCRYINYEQDLGIEGLRNAKQLYHPVKFLKKYSVSLKD